MGAAWFAQAIAPAVPMPLSAATALDGTTERSASPPRSQPLTQELSPCA
jgi:hypothetical protein